MRLPVPPLNDDEWQSLCSTPPVRPSVVAAGRARLLRNDWPDPLAIADALLAWPRPVPCAV